MLICPVPPCTSAAHWRKNMRPVTAPSINSSGESPAAVGRKVGRRLGAGLLLFVVAFQAVAQDVEPTTFWKRIKEKGLYERLWEATRLYENEDNSVIQALSIIGRYHGQFWSVNADQGNTSGWENRRFFAGAEAVLFHDFTVQAQMKFSESFDPIYDGLYQAFVKWSPAESFSLSAGRLDFLFAGLERTVSSTKIVTFERGQLANQLWPGEVVGAAAQGQVSDFSYRAGVFSGSIDQEFTDFAGGFGAVAGLGYVLPLFYENGSLHLDYLYNNGNPSNDALEPYDHAISLWHQGQRGPFDLGVDLTFGHGLDARPAVFGVTVLPTYVFARNVVRNGDAFQAVLRYQFSVSDGDNGLQLQQRYEQKVVPDGFGDRYHAVYAGINYLIFGDRFKLMTGAEYSAMHDSAQDGGAFDGWTYLAGVRVYF
jgi:phosphate-selective porin OprO and OprP